MALNEQQKAFCQLYVKYNNGSKAAAEVGYKSTSAAATLLKREDIRAYIEEIREEESVEEPIKLKMNTAAEVRQTLNLIAEMVINYKLDSRTASTLNSLCTTTLNSIRTDEMEKKMTELEELIKDLTEGKDR